MVFIHNFNAASQILSSIGNGKCVNTCKSGWVRNIKYALKTETNPLNLTKRQRIQLHTKLNTVSGRNGVNQYSRTKKKYASRNSPPYPANKNCGKTMKGNDGQMYKSIPNINNICSWKIVTK
jgi:hypothetical protein